MARDFPLEAVGSNLQVKYFALLRDVRVSLSPLLIFSRKREENQLQTEALKRKTLTSRRRIDSAHDLFSFSFSTGLSVD